MVVDLLAAQGVVGHAFAGLHVHEQVVVQMMDELLVIEARVHAAVGVQVEPEPLGVAVTVEAEQIEQGAVRGAAEFEEPVGLEFPRVGVAEVLANLVEVTVRLQVMSSDPGLALHHGRVLPSRGHGRDGQQAAQREAGEDRSVHGPTSRVGSEPRAPPA